jgi:hypothetical protein
MFSRHHLSSRQGTSASRGGAKRTAFAFLMNLGARGDPVLFYPQIVELAAIPIGRLTSRLTLAGRPSEAAWIKSQERSATDELR